MNEREKAQIKSILKIKPEDDAKLLEIAKWWLDWGCWTRKGKRAYTHSIASSLLSIAISLDKLANPAVIKKEKTKDV